MYGIVKIKRFIRKGNLNIDEQVVDSGDLAIRAAGAMLACKVEDCIGKVVFEGEDGNFYAANLKVIIERVQPSYVKRLESSNG
jgi:hypothetical protein